MTDILPNELRAPLPSSYVPAQTLALTEYLAYVQLINVLTSAQANAQLSLSVGDV